MSTAPCRGSDRANALPCRGTPTGLRAARLPQRPAGARRRELERIPQSVGGTGVEQQRRWPLRRETGWNSARSSAGSRRPPPARSRVGETADPRSAKKSARRVLTTECQGVRFLGERLRRRGRVQEWFVVLDEIHESLCARETEGVLLLRGPPRAREEDVVFADAPGFRAIVRVHQSHAGRQRAAGERRDVRPERRRSSSTGASVLTSRIGMPCAASRRRTPAGVGTARHVPHPQPGTRTCSGAVWRPASDQHRVQRAEPQQQARGGT